MEDVATIAAFSLLIEIIKQQHRDNPLECSQLWFINPESHQDLDNLYK